MTIPGDPHQQPADIKQLNAWTLADIEQVRNHILDKDNDFRDDTFSVPVGARTKRRRPRSRRPASW
ncbi:hypothetical protein [Nonomuraea rubra]|uniref:Uncharacterized protein n=2 Tax=Nonomuraea rubra TaxID=46180 RepID=A0A7X0TX93_9ACTN|nr:hypothetical protein [Nonomuraea rubra]MBB6546990.1 hypothetical protein [Nonomuraea rubra]